MNSGDRAREFILGLGMDIIQHYFSAKRKIDGFAGEYQVTSG
jgi:hypothetical protein